MGLKSKMKTKYIIKKRKANIHSTHANNQDLFKNYEKNEKRKENEELNILSPFSIIIIIIIIIRFIFVFINMIKN